MSSNLAIGNPKRRGLESFQSAWYRYYPGFSENFAHSVLSSAHLKTGQWILDPWNGSGTTTSQAISLGIDACGYDLNPVMVIVAKARALDTAEYPSLKPLLARLLDEVPKHFELSPDDPLSAWFLPRSVTAIRSVEAAIQRLLVDSEYYLPLKARGTGAISNLAAFFYVALFRALREFLRPFLTSNPTWVKRPTCRQARLRPHARAVRDAFRTEVNEMIPTPPKVPLTNTRRKMILGVASSERLPLCDASVDFVLASPPYCTRIDYAVATSVELALLGYSLDSDFDRLRRELIGSTTVPSAAPVVPSDLGETCLTFLDALSRHSSKASSTYYYKNHAQYFRSIASSLSEISRVLKRCGRCVLVVQDSYYKNLHNNLPQMFVEIADCRGLSLEEKHDFPLPRTMAGINPGANGYRRSFSATESVLVLSKLGTPGTK